MSLDAAWVTWVVAATATAGVIARPWGAPEAVWAVLGAVVLVAAGLLPWQAAAHAVGEGLDVYLFLAGMMLLSELARQEGLFDTLAAHAARAAKGSASRLFVLVYAVGVVVTVFMSNDATAVVLTPAVFAAARAAGVEDKRPYLFICAFIANAASFVLPISNPANLVVFGAQMPPLGEWLGRFALPSALSIGATFLVLRWTQRGALRAPISVDVAVPALHGGGWVAAGGIGASAAALLVASGLGWHLGWPTLACAAVVAVAVLVRRREGPWGLLRPIAWGVLPLVAGLFVLVAALEHTGVLRALARVLHDGAARWGAGAAWAAGLVAAFGCNLVNNLPAGLLAGAAVGAAAVPDRVASAVLIGIDLGPNLSVTGSLATILWLGALRREGVVVGAWAFLRLGALVMPPALALALAGLWWAGP